MAAHPVSNSELSFEVVKTPTTIVHCKGRISSNTAESLKQTVRPLIPDCDRVTLDLTEVSYLDSSGLGTIVGLFVSAKKAGCRLQLINLNPRLKELFSLTRLGEFLTEGRDPNYQGLP